MTQTRWRALPIYLLSIGLCSASTLSAAPVHHKHHAPTPTPAPTETRAELVARARALVAQQQLQLDEARTQLGEAQVILIPALQKQLSDAQGQINAVGKERDGWRQYGESQHDRWMNAETRVASQRAAILRRDIIISALVFAIVLFFFLKFYLRVPFL